MSGALTMIIDPSWYFHKDTKVSRRLRRSNTPQMTLNADQLKYLADLLI